MRKFLTYFGAWCLQSVRIILVYEFDLFSNYAVFQIPSSHPYLIFVRLMFLPLVRTQSHQPHGENKKGDFDTLANYRSISLLSTFSKITEKMIASHITHHLQTNEILSAQQFEFRKNRGKQDAVLHLQDFVMNAIDSECIPVVVLLDFSAAFDCVQHQRLLLKLERVGTRDKAIDLIRSYLTNRTQQLECAEKVSNHTQVGCGVPQGDFLSAIFFSVNYLSVNEELRHCIVRRVRR